MVEPVRLRLRLRHAQGERRRLAGPIGRGDQDRARLRRPPRLLQHARQHLLKIVGIGEAAKETQLAAGLPHAPGHGRKHDEQHDRYGTQHDRDQGCGVRVDREKRGHRPAQGPWPVTRSTRMRVT